MFSLFLELFEGGLEEGKVENVQLSAGVYSFSLGVTKEFRKHVTLKVNHLCSIKVSHKREIWHPFLLRTTQELEQDD